MPSPNAPRRLSRIASPRSPSVAACTGRRRRRTRRHAQPRLDVAAAAVPAVYLSEIHYDNTGTDADEAIEINAPAGTDLTGWQVVLYNGNGGASTTRTTLSGTIPATCGTRGVVVLTYAVNGIQNGGSTAAPEPDGMALVNQRGTVVEFLSYEGVFAAANGPATGTTSVDIGVQELGTEPVGQSLQRSGADVWSGPAASTFGACNARWTAARGRRERHGDAGDRDGHVRAARRRSRQRRSTPRTSRSPA